jgi:hypothetical protein
MSVVALEIRYADNDRPVVEVRIGDEWYPGEVHRSRHTGSAWLLEVGFAHQGSQHCGTFRASCVRPITFPVVELDRHEVPLT